jgi:hypothetical protein
MKKILSMLMLAGIVTFIACGPSAKEKAEKAKQDSIMMADSIAKVEMMAKQKADSIAMVEKAIHIKDSLKLDSIAKATAKSTKKATKKVETKEAKSMKKARG